MISRTLTLSTTTLSIICLSLVSSVVNGVERCNDEGINKCLEKLNSAATPQAFLPTVLLKQCRQFESVKKCVAPYLKDCGQNQAISWKMSTHFMKYSCSPSVRDDINDASKCLSVGKYTRLLKKCDMNDLGKSCKDAKKLLSCVSGYVGKVCNSKIARLYHNLLASLVNLQRSVLNTGDCHIKVKGDDRRACTGACHVGYIIGMCVGGLIVVGLLVGLTVFCVRRRDRITRSALVNNDVLAKI